jgi:hypothetical protein
MLCFRLYIAVPPQYQFPTNGKQPVILGPKGIPYAVPQTLSASAQQKSIQVVPTMFEDGAGLMALHNHSYDFSDHLGGEGNT